MLYFDYNFIYIFPKKQIHGMKQRITFAISSLIGVAQSGWINSDYLYSDTTGTFYSNPESAYDEVAIDYGAIDMI